MESGPGAFPGFKCWRADVSSSMVRSPERLWPAGVKTLQRWRDGDHVTTAGHNSLVLGLVSRHTKQMSCSLTLSLSLSLSLPVLASHSVRNCYLSYAKLTKNHSWLIWHDLSAKLLHRHTYTLSLSPWHTLPLLSHTLYLSDTHKHIALSLSLSLSLSL